MDTTTVQTQNGVLSCKESTDEYNRAVGNIEQFLQQAIQQLEPDNNERRRAGPGRPRILPNLCLWAGLLVCVLHGFSSQLALWRLLTAKQLWSYPRFAVTDQAIYKRLATAGTAPLERLFEQISEVLRERLAPYALTELAPFATEVVALDETTLDPVTRHLPVLRGLPPGSDRLLPGKLAGVFDIRQQQWRKIQHISDAHQNEKVVARNLIAAIPPGSLILADLGYFGFAWFDDLTDAQQWWVSRLRAKTSYLEKHVYYKQGDVFDGIVWLGAYRADKAAHAVRLVRFKIGPNTYTYITNVLDPHQLSIKEIAQLYAHRWDIEMAIKTLKRHLNLHLLWSSKTVVILQQVWAVLIIAQILQALQMEIAGRAGVDPFDVSLALLVEYAPRYALDGIDPVTAFVNDGRRLRFIRPSRRIRTRAPDIPPEDIKPLPESEVLLRTPRYARRKCGRGAERDK